MGLKGAAHRSLDLRYRRQGYELNVAFDGQAPAHSIEAFHQLHRQRYGFSDAERPVEIVNLRLRMVAAARAVRADAARVQCPGMAAPRGMRSERCSLMADS